MKKTLMIALAGMTLFAFTQCGGGGVSGSQEYQDCMKLYQDFEKTVKNAKTCDELSEALTNLFVTSLADDKEYADNEKMTEDERDKFEEYSETVEELFQKQAEKLGCEEDDFKLF
jgi:uncharacterized Fe-S cluster-containing protein